MIAKIQAYEAGFGEGVANGSDLATDVERSGAGDFRPPPTRSSPRWRRRPFGGRAHRSGHDGDRLARTNSRTGSRPARASSITRATAASPTQAKESAESDGRPSDDQRVRAPVVVALSCLVGRFEAPGVNSLGELLMRKAGGAPSPSGDPRACRATPGDRTGGGLLSRRPARRLRHAGGGHPAGAPLAAGRRLHRDTLRHLQPAGRSRPAHRRQHGRAQATRPSPSGAGSASAPPIWPTRSPAAPPTNNFFDYAMGGGYDVLAELPEFGFELPPRTTGPDSSCAGSAGSAAPTSTTACLFPKT
jgi:hypothetical protein